MAWLPDVRKTHEETRRAYEQSGAARALGTLTRGTVRDAGKYLFWDNPVVEGWRGIGSGMTDFAAGVVAGAPQAPRAAVAAPAKSAASQQQARPSPVGAPHTSPGVAASLRDGLRYTADASGNRTYSMGTPGQAGYGKITVPGRQPARQRVASGVPQMGAGSGYSFEGSAEDAARFFAPVARTAGSIRGPQDSGQRAAFLAQRAQEQGTARQLAAPTYLGPESGLGWKTRLAMYKEQMDAYNQALGRDSALDIEAMREAGAGDRALLHAAGVNERNAIDRLRLGGDLKTQAYDIQEKQLGMQEKRAQLDFANEVANLRRQLAAAEPGTPEHEQLTRKLIAMSNNEAQEQRPDVRVIDVPVPGDSMGATRQVPIRLDPSSGTYTEMRHVGESGARARLLQEIHSDKNLSEAFAKKSPAEQEAYIKEHLERYM